LTTKAFRHGGWGYTNEYWLDEEAKAWVGDRKLEENPQHLGLQDVYICCGFEGHFCPRNGRAGTRGRG